MLHVVGFGDDVPEQLFCISSGSKELLVFCYTFCCLGEVFQLVSCEDETWAVSAGPWGRCMRRWSVLSRFAR